MTKTKLERHIREVVLDPYDEVGQALLDALVQLADARDAIDDVSGTLPGIINGDAALEKISGTLGNLVYWEVDEALEAVRAVLTRHLGQ